MKSGEHVLWDAHLSRAQLRELIRRGPSSAEALGASMRAFGRAVERASLAMVEASRLLAAALADDEGGRP